jgi:hypothetical protein
VYFIGPEATKLRAFDTTLCVKIGFTSGCPQRRMNSFQAGSPVPLELLAYTDGTLALERAFHEVFAPLASHREWFFFCDRLSSFLWYLDAAEPFIPRERLINAISDILWPDSPVPHPSIDEAAWRSSAHVSPLLPFFPELTR